MTYADIYEICQNKTAKTLETRKISPRISIFFIM